MICYHCGTTNQPWRVYPHSCYQAVTDYRMQEPGIYPTPVTDLLRLQRTGKP